MHRFLIIVTAAVVFASAVVAGEPPHQFSQPPPPEGTEAISFEHKTIVCKNLDAVKAIVVAGKESAGAFDDQFAVFAEKKACLPDYVYVNGVTVGESVDLGVNVIGGIRRHDYAVHVGNINEEFYVLYEQGEIPDVQAEGDGTPI